ncbi:hypothetical protein Pla52o_29640 [Novipirellula galeiformis]|uniref:Uncharacterized protein n=1 Tax=Novipirellula galeiformis TaxID=2528004 RepID=A0A5C6CGI0_9BACT|nr:hypothetical protein [Novipirellula galeiformis]TWU23428.1 hypothetical protein Pla52o_29640 [Novipirellula galeiformis]
MPIPYPKELTLPHWKTKKSRLVTAQDLERLLVKLESQHKAIDQVKLSASGYRNLVTVESVKQAIEAANRIHSRHVTVHTTSLKQTQALAKKTADRLVRARTVPKADIDLVRAIESASATQLDAWADPSKNGKRSFEKQLRVLELKQSPLLRKIEQAIKETSLAIKATKLVPTVPYWIVGKESRLKCKPIGNKSVEIQCKSLQGLLNDHPSFASLSATFKSFSDDYPRKQKRIRIADPKLERSSPVEYQRLLLSEQQAVAGCLVDLTNALKDLKRKLNSMN